MFLFFSAPSPPRNLTLSVASSTSIKVSWLEPLKKNGHLRRYVIRYSSAKDNLVRLVYTTETTYLLTSLQEFTVYFVRVVAETTLTGKHTHIEQVKTFEDCKLFVVLLF